MNGVFVEGVRISTIITACCFGLIGLLRGGDMRALIASAAWLTGFETAYQVTAAFIGTETYPAAIPLLMLPGLIVVPLAAWRYNVRPSLPLLAATAAIWIVWMATGFHENEPEMHKAFSISAEILNEGTKTLLALAYAWPLLNRVRLRRPEPVSS